MAKKKLTSKYKGVFMSSGGKWQAQVELDGKKKKTLITTDNEKEAALEYYSFYLQYYNDKVLQLLN